LVILFERARSLFRLCCQENYILLPNVILITIDSLRADRVSCLGYSEQSTPNIDYLAKSGALFSQCYSNGGGSVESFPSIVTSTYVLMNPNSSVERGTFWVKLSENWQTISQVFGKAGYATAAFKNEKTDLCSYFGYSRGFDVFEDFLVEYPRNFLSRNKQKISTAFGNKFVRADKLTKMAMKWLRRARTCPFFLWLHYMDVHSPPNPKDLSVLQRLKALHLMRKITDGNPDIDQEELTQLVKLYEKEVHYIDAQIGDLTKQFAEIGISPDNTYLILLSDHGDQFMEHGELGHGRLYDELLHVPLVIAGPNVPNNLRIAQQVSLIDVCPTVTDLCGLPKSRTFQGKSLLSSINGSNAKQNDYTISETLLKDYSIRTQDWKYILHTKTKTHELFNLAQDPSEKIELSNQFPEKTHYFRRSLVNHIQEENEAAEKLRKERDDFSREFRDFLEKYPSKNVAFISRVFGASYDNGFP
jgi:arylsulfatase A-like enzyme